MKEALYFIVYLVIISLSCTSQQDDVNNRTTALQLHPADSSDPAEQHYFIKRYQGYIQSTPSIPISMLLLSWGDQRLSGNIQYQDHLGQLSFAGEVGADQQFSIREQRFKQTNATYSGSFQTDGSLTGTWSNVDQSEQFPFQLEPIPLDSNAAAWTGAWHLNDPWDTCTLIIGGVTDYKLQYALNIYINNYRHFYFGTAELVSDTIASVSYLDEPHHQENCQLIFHRRGEEIYLEQESFPFLCGLPDNCWIEGRYAAKYLGSVPYMQDHIGPKSIFRDTAQYLSWLALVGKENEPWFAYSMERTDHQQTWADFHDFAGSLWKGRVRGFHREKEAVVAYDQLGNIWTAVTTPPKTRLGPMKVHYFTNHPRWKSRMPKGIKEWMKDFRNCTVVYESK